MLFLDYETRSRVDLRKSNVYAYCECPDFQVLMCAWAFGDDPVQLTEGSEETASVLGDWLRDPTVTKVAHNANFERVVTSRLLGVAGYLDPEPWVDTAALAVENGLPRSLDDLAKALGAEEKDSAGTRLINLFSKPNRKGEFVSPADKPAEWQDFAAYCRQDVATLRDIWSKLPSWPTEHERQLWIEDARINDRGLLIDLELADAAIEADKTNREEFSAELRKLLDIENPGSTQQMLAGLKSIGIDLPNLQAATVAGAYEKTPHRALELRQALSLSAAKKFSAAKLNVCRDRRIRGAFKFFGAHTGRWSGGAGLQPQNLPRDTVPDPRAAALDVQLFHRAEPKTLKALVRHMLTGPFTVCDYSAIEARVLAWLAGERWVLDAFMAGRDIYQETADRAGGLTRQQGKAMVLGCGFVGSHNALRRVGAEGSDEELKELVTLWRRANPKIVRFWSKLERAYLYGGQAGPIEVQKTSSARRVVLPSGRALVYRGVQIVRSRFGEPELLWHSGRGEVRVWPGISVENVTQAVARDLLADALVRMSGPYNIVGHIHDELIAGGEYDVQQMEADMCLPPDWAPGLPLAAEGTVMMRYQK